MKIFGKVKPIQVKRTFLIADRIAHRKNLGNNRAFLKDLSEEEFNKKLLGAKRTVLKLKEEKLDKLITPQWKKRVGAYNKSQWFLAEVSPKEVGVWKRA